MPSQDLVIAKIGGQASVDTLRRFREWSALRACTNPSEWEPEQWPENARMAADTWANQLRAHRHEPPVIFFAEYVDTWSYCPPSRYFGDHGAICIMANRYELFCLPLPVTSEATAVIEELCTSGQFDEDRLFGTLTLAAVNGWNKIVDQAVVVFLRLVVRPTVEDQEVLGSLKVLPDWMRSGR